MPASLPRLLWLPALLVAALAETPSSQAWDFAPKEARTFVDGPAPRHYFIPFEKRKISFRVDKDTKVSGTSTATEITFATSYSTLTLAQSPLNEKKPAFDEKNLPLYEEAARKLLPPGSTDIVLSGEGSDVFPINGWSSHQYVFTYAYYGRAIQSSLTFLNYNAKEQWVLNISSNPEQFADISSRAARILNTFFETDLSYQLEDAPN